jgi:hypothetical protein
MYLTTTTTPQWQHTDGSTRQATGTDHHCLDTFPSAAQVSLYPPQRTQVAAGTTVPLSHELPHQNWTAYNTSESSSRAQTRYSHMGRDRGCKGVIQNTPAKMAEGVPYCVDSMWACVIVEYKHTPGQVSSFYWHCCRMCLRFTWTTLILLGGIWRKRCILKSIKYDYVTKLDNWYISNTSKLQPLCQK